MPCVTIVGGHVLQSQTFFKRAFVKCVALKKKATKRPQSSFFSCVGKIFPDKRY